MRSVVKGFHSSAGIWYTDKGTQAVGSLFDRFLTVVCTVRVPQVRRGGFH